MPLCYSSLPLQLYHCTVLLGCTTKRLLKQSELKYLEYFLPMYFQICFTPKQHKQLQWHNCGMGGDRQETQTNRAWEGSNFLNQPYTREHALNFRFIYQAMFHTGGLGRDGSRQPGLLSSFSSSGKLLLIKNPTPLWNKGNLYFSRAHNKPQIGHLTCYLFLHAL